MSNPFDDIEALKARAQDEGKRPPAGNLGQFVLGLAMSLAGGYMLLTQVQVSSGGFWGRTYFGGVTPFGATMILFILGVVLLFYDSDKIWGWALAGGSLVIVLIGLIANLRIYLVSTPFYVLLVMLILLFGGLGLMLRSQRGGRSAP